MLSSPKPESQKRREDRLTERAVKGTDFRAETPPERNRQTGRQIEKDSERGETQTHHPG